MALVGGPGVLVCAWTNFVGTPRVRASRSTNGGATWSASVAISATFGGQPALAIDPVSGDICCVWSVGTVMRFSSSADGGATRAPVIDVRSSPFGMAGPVLAVTTTAIVCAWSENDQSFASHSLDGGATWTPPVLIAPVTDHSPREPSLATSPNGTLVACGYATSSTEIGLATTPDDGATWTDPR